MMPGRDNQLSQVTGCSGTAPVHHHGEPNSQTTLPASAEPSEARSQDCRCLVCSILVEQAKTCRSLVASGLSLGSVTC